MTWSIVADSSCDLPSGTLQSYGVNFATVPLKIIIGNLQYVDDDSLNVNIMLGQMKTYSGPSSSACPSPEEWANEFRKSDCTIAVAMTGALSGTYNSAVVAKNMVLEEDPNKKIHVIDSHTTSGGMALIIWKAAELIRSGLDFEAVTQQLEDYVSSLFLLFSLSSYNNLIKSGRMSALAGKLATTLGIRAIASNTPQGEIKILQKPRGEERAIRLMVETMSRMKDLEGKPVVITHCNNLKGAQQLKELIMHVCFTKKITILPTRGLCSFYTEDGGLLIGF
jgi:DegV family protein with EDD domain